MNTIYIYGASGHGIVVADIAKSCGFENIIFIDDGENEYLSFEDVKENNDIPFALGIGSNSIRKKLYEKLELNSFEIKTLIHPSAVVSSDITLGPGTIVMPKVVVNASSKIGKGSILNSSSLIEHECQIGDFVHISPGALLAGNVKVGDLSHVGIGTVVIQGLEIGINSLVGAGSVVVKNISNNKKAYGNPCKEVGNINE